MKKCFRIVLILIFIFIIVFLINFIRNYSILNSLFSYSEVFSTYSFEEIIKTNNITYKNCIYFQNNIYYIKVFENDEHIYNIWIDNINNEYILQTIKDNKISKEEYNDFYTKKYKSVYLNSHDFTVLKLIVENYLFRPILENNNEYILTIYDNESTIWVNKENKMIFKIISNNTEINYNFNNQLPENIEIHIPQI